MKKLLLLLFLLSALLSNAQNTLYLIGLTSSTNALSTVITTGSTNATVAIWYDQSGNGVHVLQNSNGTASIISSGTINTMNGQPTVKFNAHNYWLTSSNTINTSSISEATLNVVAQNINSDDYISGIVAVGIGGYGLSYNPTTNTSAGKGYNLDGSGCINTDAQAWSNTETIVTGFKNTTTGASSIYLNSAKSNSTLTCNIGRSSTDNVFVGSRGGNGANREFLGNISETMMFPKTLSASEQAALESSQASFLPQPPGVTITSSASGAVCAGTNVTFTANAQDFTSPYYQWYKNSIAINGATSSTYSSSSLVNGDQVNVKVNEGPFGGAVTSNGLILNLDATNSSSYPGSGTTWNNLVTGNAVPSFSITSGTYFNSNGGVIRFPSTGGFAESSTGFANLTRFTVEVWVKPAGTKGDQDPIVSSNYAPCLFSEKVSGGTVNMALAYNSRAWYGAAHNSYRYTAAMGGWSTFEPTTNYGSDLNNWVQLTATYNGSILTLYRNGVSLGSKTTNVNLRASSVGYFIAHRWDMADGVYGDYSKVMMYDKDLTSAEVSANYSAFNARFVEISVSSLPITTTVNASPSVPTITVTGDACANKTTLTTSTGLGTYTWYKDNVVIASATSNTYTPTASGVYKVTVSNGTCTNTSSTSTIYECGRTADGSMVVVEGSSTLISRDGSKNTGKGVDDRGKILTKPLTYGTVTTATGRVWLDRNLGATQVATSSTDAAAYGDYYQWGRPADGHQTKYLTNNNSTGFTNTRSATAVPSTDLWIAPNDGSDDWLITADNTLWTGTNPASNPCPAGFRIPTLTEWQTEQARFASNNATGAFNYSLKLTMPGWLEGFSSSGAGFTATGGGGFYLTQTANTTGSVQYFGINSGNVWTDTNLYKRQGLSVRCIQN